MKVDGKVIKSGDILYVPSRNGWERFTVSDWSEEPIPAVFGRLENGSYLRMSDRAKWKNPDTEPPLIRIVRRTARQMEPAPGPSWSLFDKISVEGRNQNENSTSRHERTAESYRNDRITSGPPRR